MLGGHHVKGRVSVGSSLLPGPSLAGGPRGDGAQPPPGTTVHPTPVPLPGPLAGKEAQACVNSLLKRRAVTEGPWRQKAPLARREGSSSLLRNCRDTDASAAGVNGYRYPYWEEDEDFSPSFQIAPFWAYILGALGLFIYQSLDAIDGKQARRTNSSSPLGELFDHGCDSISTVFVVLGSCIAVRLGTNPDWLFFCCFVGLFMFYSAHWQTYVSGILRFGKVDVTEVQIAITVLLLISAYAGTAIWDYRVPLVGLELKFFAVFGILCGTALSFFNYFRVIFGGGVGKNGSTIAGTSVLSPGLHIGLLITLAIVIYKKSTTRLFEKHSCLYVLTFGFVNAKISQKLVVAHMTKSEICLQDTAFIGPGLLFLDQYFNSFVDEYIVLWIALFISLFDMLRYAAGVCLQIAAHLHIRVFRISSHQAPEQVQNHND
ncbi:cholinephosphotransferase 1 [Egretta garzetta]|uniref:cholinephosphotransferase 1 n=1 Tax=Egretta garzetta TaxID=188379 RepID=UPI00163B9AB9|nr:cholinephosphotransferase 1 [Egretta garzetta]